MEEGCRVKLRVDFVTNSSSSSYLLAYKPNSDHKNEKAYELLEYLMYAVLNSDGDYGETESAEYFKTKEEFDEYIVDNCGYSSDKSVKELLEEDMIDNDYYNDCLQAFEDGGSLIRKRVGYGDYAVRDIIKKMEEIGFGLKIIDCE